MNLETSLLVAFIGFVPMITILWYTLAPYTYPKTIHTFFDERKVSICLAVGMFIGMTFGILQQWLFSGWIVLAFLFAIVEELIKLVILNSPWLQLKFDTVFYGAALGLGHGSMFVISFAARAPMLSNPVLIPFLLLYGINHSFLHAVTGTYIGIGCAKGIAFAQTARAIGLHLLFNYLILAFIWPIAGASPLSWHAAIFSLFGATTLTTALYFYTVKSVLPYSLPLEIQRERRREMRIRARAIQK